MQTIILTTLLDSTQTYIGVIITLIVLCLYESKDNNYLRKIAGNFSLDILGDMKTKLRAIQDAINDTETKLPDNKPKSVQETVMDNFDYWFKVATDEDKQRLSKNRRDLENVKALLAIKIANKEQDYKERQERFEERKGDRLMALYILIIAMSVMIIDCFFPPSRYAAFSLLSLSIIILFYSTVIWKRFYKGLEQREEAKAPSHSFARGFIRLILDFAPFLILLWVFSTSAMHCLVWPAYIFVLWLVCFTHFHWGALSYVDIDNYNNRLIAFHALYHLCLSFCYGLILWGAIQLITPVYTISSYGIFSENVASLVNVEAISCKAFALIIGLDAFFVPILLCFFFYRNVAHTIVNEIENDYKASQKDINTLKQEYTRIVQDIQNKVTTI